MKYYVILAFALVGSTVQGGPIAEEQNVIKSDSPEIFKSFETCITKGNITQIINCAASRMLKSIEKATSESVINVGPGITLISDNSVSSRQAKEIKDEPLPTDPQEKTNKLMDLLVNATSRFFAGRTLKVQIPVVSKESVARAIEEGRGKMKKMVGQWMLGVGATMLTMVPLMLGGLSLMAAKALMIGKLAFVVSMILFVQYFFSGRGGVIPYAWYGGSTGGYGGYGSYGTYGTNNIGGWGTSAQYPYARSLNSTPKENQEDSKKAAELAYAEQVQ